MNKCLNCDNTLSLSDKYCNACGQKAVFPKLNFTNIVKDFLSNLFNVENKIWSTLKEIWIPGKLTSEYVAGRRHNYYNPLRIFLVVLFLLFTVVVIHLNKSIEGINEFKEESLENIWENKMKRRFDSLSITYPVLNDTVFRQSLFDDNGKSMPASVLNEENQLELISIVRQENSQDPFRNREILDSLVKLQGTYRYTFGENNPVDTVSIPGISSDYNFSGSTINNIDMNDFLVLSPEQLKVKHGKGGYSDFMLVQGQKIIKDLQSSIVFGVSNGTWAIILQVLLMGILFKFLYIRRGHLYAEHIIFHTYGHTRFLLVGLIFLILALVLPLMNYLGIFFSLWLLTGAIYLFAGMKTYYKQSKRKTFVKWVMTLFAYSIGLLLCSLLIFVLSAVML